MDLFERLTQTSAASNAVIYLIYTRVPPCRVTRDQTSSCLESKISKTSIISVSLFNFFYWFTFTAPSSLLSLRLIFHFLF